jgi:hypothetical protein
MLVNPIIHNITQRNKTKPGTFQAVHHHTKKSAEKGKIPNTIL